MNERKYSNKNFTAFIVFQNTGEERISSFYFAGEANFRRIAVRAL